MALAYEALALAGWLTVRPYFFYRTCHLLGEITFRDSRFALMASNSSFQMKLMRFATYSCRATSITHVLVVLGGIMDITLVLDVQQTSMRRIHISGMFSE
jgi:hypothetical protein